MTKTITSLQNAIQDRLKKSDKKNSKMSEMARQSVQGHLTSFSGIFSISDLTAAEKNYLEELLREFTTGKGSVEEDLGALIHLTSEVKAINNQAAILHGERIKKAHTILTRYRDGAFTAWLLAAYGNRQTPYNFLQYYDFYETLPKPLRPKLETMPRQAIYSLASRQGPFPLKQEIVQNYAGETKNELLEKIRDVFPLEISDKRARNYGDSAIAALAKVSASLQRKRLNLSKTQKQAIASLLDEIRTKIQGAQ